ncbi:glycoside hydrolase family 16 protein [Hydnomerulius pinastri MD-312]|nr:glycoside hydrolase family 16 protein [Hydnomerulius pinastri MD-312]
MRPQHAIVPFLVLAEAAYAQLLQAWTGQYVLNVSYVGQDFLDGFNFQTMDDPTHGYVNYVDQDTALQKNLTYVTDSTFVMRADDLTSVSPGARGRDSIRIMSQDAYGDALYMLDIAHMPAGCATWPAWWTLSQQGPWPQGGEIDIIEGVNLSPNNLASLHTMPNCSMSPNRAQKGTTASTNCDTSYNYNQGCGTNFKEPQSYGAAFNQAGGGYFMMERDATKGISMWFVPRSTFPTTALFDGSPDPNPNQLSATMPDAYFPTYANCNSQGHFNDHSIVFDLTLCGDWAGNQDVWNASGCAAKALDFVNNNPDEFSEAYWEINSLKIYTRQSSLASAAVLR